MCSAVEDIYSVKKHRLELEPAAFLSCLNFIFVIGIQQGEPVTKAQEVWFHPAPPALQLTDTVNQIVTLPYE